VSHAKSFATFLQTEIVIKFDDVVVCDDSLQLLHDLGHTTDKGCLL
jgi:hypothetical protein